MELYNLNILGLSETKVQSNGKKVIDEARRCRRWNGRGESERWCAELAEHCLDGMAEKLEVHEREMCYDQVENQGLVDNVHTNVYSS